MQPNALITRSLLAAAGLLGIGAPASPLTPIPTPTDAQPAPVIPQLPLTWTERPELAKLLGVTVYSSPRPPGSNASAYYMNQPDGYSGQPYVWLKGKYVKPMQKILAGKKPRHWRAALALATLANEYAHITGQDATDVGGFDGGVGHRPTILRLSRELLGKAGVTDRKYQDYLIKRIKSFY